MSTMADGNASSVGVIQPYIFEPPEEVCNSGLAMEEQLV